MQRLLKISNVSLFFRNVKLLVKTKSTIHQLHYSHMYTGGHPLKNPGYAAAVRHLKTLISFLKKVHRFSKVYQLNEHNSILLHNFRVLLTHN